MGLVSTYLSLAGNSSWLWIAALLLVLYYIYMRGFIAFFDSTTHRTDEKTFLITGAETGIGSMIVDLLAARGGRIIMACKDVNLGQETKAKIETRTLNDRIEVHHLDLSSLDSVRQFSKDIHKTVDRLDVLINNAAIACSPKEKTADGLNTIMQVNHFGPFLLTNLLLDLIKKAAPSRIIFISSIAHHLHKYDVDNLNCDKQPLPACRVYCNSKLANILTAKFFAKKLQGTGITVNTVHPGTVKTNLTSSPCAGSSLIGLIFSLWVNIFGLSPREGAMTPTYAAAEPKISHLTGVHFSSCQISSCVAKIANDSIAQEKLFTKSAELVQLKPEEIQFSVY